MKMAKHCYLRPIEGRYKPSIVLEDKNPVILGRGPKTGIKNTFCARSQVMVTAIFEEFRVKVTQIGRNPCTVNGEPLAQKTDTFLYHDQKLSLLQGQYSYILTFNPPPGKVVKMASEISDSDEECSESPAKVARIEEKSREIQIACWEVFDGELLIYKSQNIVHQAKIAGFDLDGTLIAPKSGGTFPTNMDDWKIIYNDTAERLAKLTQDGYKIVIFTNQGSLTNSRNVEDFKIKIQNIAEKLGVPIEVYIAKGQTTKYRKPCIGMWEVMEARNGRFKVNKNESFYCGDAAGRIAGILLYKGIQMRKSVDHSQCDYFFAKNIGIKFYTPEEHFLSIVDNRVKQFTAFDPAEISVDVPLCDESKQIISPRKELVLLVGSPASGKTQFSLTHMVPAGYWRVNRDQLKTIEQCLKMTQHHLNSGRSVVVDNTNGTKEVRARYIMIARKLGIQCRAFVMNISIRHAKHNNKFRMLVDHDHAVVGEPVINSYFKSYVQPSPKEGFHEVVNINFWPMFKDRLHEKIYNLVLCEK